MKKKTKKTLGSWFEQRREMKQKKCLVVWYLLRGLGFRYKNKSGSNFKFANLTYICPTHMISTSKKG